MKLKKLLSGVIGVFMLMTMVLPANFMADGMEDGEIMDNYVLQELFSTAEARHFTSGEASGFGFLNSSVQYDVSDIPDENIALSARIYIENREDHGNVQPLIDLLSDTGANVFAQFELASGNPRRYRTWQLRNVRRTDGEPLQAGMNDILLPLTTSGGSAEFDKSAINWFRFEIARLPMNEFQFYSVRFKDIAIVDTSRPKQTPQETVYKTDYLVGDIPLVWNTTFTSAATVQSYLRMNGVNPNRDPIDASEHDFTKLQLLLEVDITASAENLAVLNRGGMIGQIEITSGGASDVQELNWNVNSIGWKDGLNTYSLLLSTAGIQGGAFNSANIDYMRIFFHANGFPADFTGPIGFNVVSVRLVDVTTVESKFMLPTVFGNGMMFQQGKDINVFGYNSEGREIKAELYKDDTLLETETAIAAGDEKWQVSFSPQEAGFDRYSLKIYDGEDLEATAIIEDILIGEIWMAGGQSNMEYRVDGVFDNDQLLNNADNPNIRYFLMPTRPSGNNTADLFSPVRDIPGARWGYGNDKTDVGRMSGIAYVFAKNLQEELGVPVGIIDSSIGGTVIEGWLSRDAIEGHSEVKRAMDLRGLYFSEDWWPAASGDYMTTLYNQKVGPLKGFNLAGALWYQGESNSNRAEIYDIQLDLLIKDWGKTFNFEGNQMPFVFTQLAPWRYDRGTVNNQHLGWISEAMTRAWRMNESSNTAMITIYDIPLDHRSGAGGNNAIHPGVKIPVGERFFHSALNMIYKDGGEYTAPVYRDMTVSQDDGSIYITFDRVGDGLKIINGDPSLHGFTIAGSDNIYVNAKAEIVSKDTVRVWNDRILSPANVAYAFDNMNQWANLANSTDIPAAPFRTYDPGDTTMAPNPDIHYFTAADWIYAEGDIWSLVGDDRVPDPDRNHSWTVGPIGTGADNTYSHSTEIKSEGRASVKFEYGSSGTIGPVLSYQTLKLTLEKYNFLSVAVLSPDPQTKTISLNLQSSGSLYTAAVDGTNRYSAPIRQSSEFLNLSFNLKNLVDSQGNRVSESQTKTILEEVDAIAFLVNDNSPGTLYLDDLSFGMDSILRIKGDVNDDKNVDVKDIIAVRDHILGQKILADPDDLSAADANQDGVVNIFDMLVIRDLIVRRSI
ncbi:MAG: dockerin type I domain-containing protein [Oscillospiraceae bacterium]|nr:dockerin type I domain-containing protein [Oscillospiraceae bacterium]